MAVSRIQNVRVAGIASAVPDRTRTMKDDAARFGEEEMRRVVKNTGVTTRSVADHLCTSDLCGFAAERLLADLGWSRDSIDVLVLVTQTPDYSSPATSCLIQTRLGLGTGCAAFDVNLGCSGYTYGLWMVANFLQTGGLKRALVLAGDTVSRAAAPDDRAVVPLFGDGGSATALEYSPGAPVIDCVMGTDGRGGKHLHCLAGGYKHRFSPADFEMYLRADGVVRSNEQTFMNGPEVLTFAIESVPPLLAATRAAAGWAEQDVDHYVFHQASQFMVKTVARCSRLPPAKVVLGLEGYGNTSSTSIPLAINDQLREKLTAGPAKVILAGFGIGWSWCSLATTLGPTVLPPVLRMPDVEHRGEFEDLELHRRKTDDADGAAGGAVG